MHRFIVCVLACLSLQFTLSVEGKWEVINDVMPFDDSVTQQELLSNEDLIPVVARKPSKKRPTAQGQTARHADVINAPAFRHPRRENLGMMDFRGEDVLPLGVPQHRASRHLMQLTPVQGPMLPPSAERQRLRQKLGLANLSSAAPCQDSPEDDCLFDVDEFVSQQAALGIVDTEMLDFDFDEPKPAFTDLKPEEQNSPSVRRRRQANNGNSNNGNNNNGNNNNGNNNNNNGNNNNGNGNNNNGNGNNNNQGNDGTDEGSGTGPDDLYNTRVSHSDTGQYSYTNQFATPYNGSTISQADKDRYRQELQRKLRETYNNTLPGFTGVVVGEPVLSNGVLVANYTIGINGATAASSANVVGETNVEQFLLDKIDNAVRPAVNNLTVFGEAVHPSYQLGTGFVNGLVSVLGDYCQSSDPCPDLGPEYNKSACVNDGFMSGYCPHKCTNFPCQNSAACELDSDYNPVCNCGKRFTGQYCEERVRAEPQLTRGEKVGVGVACAVAFLAIASLISYTICCRRRSNTDVDYSYYEDEGSQRQLSDPTSAQDFYIRRPRISPVSVFNPYGTFDA